MLNWVKFIVAFLVILSSVIIVIVFYNAEQPFSFAKKAATKLAVESGQLAVVRSAEIYNGTVASVTVFGSDKDGKAKAIFVTESEKGDYKEVLLSDGISADNAVATVKKEMEVQKVLHVTLGMETEGPVWEVAFKNNSGKLNYVYIFFENGQWWKRILNL